MIRSLIRKFRTRRVTKRVSDNEIRKLCRKLPVLIRKTVDVGGIAHIVNTHSFTARWQRLYFRYLDGKMGYVKQMRLQSALRNRELEVQDSIGNQFGVDRKWVARKIDRVREAVEKAERREKWVARKTAGKAE